MNMRSSSNPKKLSSSYGVQNSGNISCFETIDKGLDAEQKSRMVKIPISMLPAGKYGKYGKYYNSVTVSGSEIVALPFPILDIILLTYSQKFFSNVCAL
jgi:hypothetical protein